MLKTNFIWVCFAMVLFSCEKDEDPSPQDLIEGKWIIVSSEILGQVVPGDGSYLQFNSCSSSCNGSDYRASDMTTGNFTYDLSDDASTIAISDTTDNGGNYNATWDILDLTATDFRIVGNTIFGSLKIEMEK